jgi:hypothetical protein
LEGKTYSLNLTRQALQQNRYLSDQVAITTSYYYLGDIEMALENFRESRKVYPSLKINKNKFPPEIIQLY